MFKQKSSILFLCYININRLMRLFVFFILMFYFLYSKNIYADELYERSVSVRALGMGNAYTAVVNNLDSLFYNPAGLAKFDSLSWRIFDLGLAIDGLDLAERIEEAQKTEGIEAFDSFYGSKVYGNLNGKLGIAIPKFAFGLFNQAILGADFHNPAYPDLNVNYNNDYGYLLGFAYKYSEKLFFGLNLKRIVRTGGNIPIGLNTFTQGSSEIENEINQKGVGLGLDIGMNYLLPVYNQNISFVWKNVGNTSFNTLSSTVDAPDSLNSEMIIGYSILFDLPLISIRPAIDIKHFNNSEVQLGKKVHIGTELSLPLLDIRAGFYQGYYTLGAGIDFWLLRFDVATYGVELGEYSGQHEDRRFAAQITMEISFDVQSFNFLGASTKERRKLKQRR